MRRAKRTEPPPRRARLEIVELGAQGEGVGYEDEKPVYAPLTAPGDVIDAEIRGERGRILDLIEASPHRRRAPCRHYGACGGCSLQHLDEAYYRAWKRSRVVEALARAGLRDVPVAAIIPIRADSRRRALFAVKQARERARLGFKQRRSWSLVDIDVCSILHPDLQARLPALKALARLIEAPAFTLAATLCRNGLDIDLGGANFAPPAPAAISRLTDAMRASGCIRLSFRGETQIVFERPIIEFDGAPVAPPPGAFLQASREGEAALIGLVRENAGNARKVCDLFAGCGAFSLPLACAASVVAVDNDAPAVEALAEASANAQRLALPVKPIRVVRRDLFERPLTVEELSHFDAVVFDPPRAGARAQAETLALSSAPMAIAVSCNPATFARDAAILVAGGYRLEKVTPVDQFVYSAHVELVGVFRKR